MQKHTVLCEDSIRNNQPQKMVDNTSSIARLANRVLMVAKQEADNSEDPSFIARVNAAANALERSESEVHSVGRIKIIHLKLKVVICFNLSQV